GAQGVIAVAPEFGWPTFRASLRDVGWRRERRTAKLGSQAVELRARPPPRHRVDRQRELVTHLPRLKSLVRHRGRHKSSQVTNRGSDGPLNQSSTPPAAPAGAPAPPAGASAPPP